MLLAYYSFYSYIVESNQDSIKYFNAYKKNLHQHGVIILCFSGRYAGKIEFSKILGSPLRTRIKFVFNNNKSYHLFELCFFFYFTPPCNFNLIFFCLNFNKKMLIYFYFWTIFNNPLHSLCSIKIQQNNLVAPIKKKNYLKKINLYLKNECALAKCLK